MNTKCMIIEDEPLAAERLQGFIAKLDKLQLVAVHENPLMAIEALNAGEIDLLFLDINLKEMSGIEFIESIQFQGKVILTTAYDEYALKGYELEVVDYLLKPFSFERFLNAVTKYQQHTVPKTQKEFVFIKTENRLEKISLEEILYIKGMGDYRQIICQHKKIMTLQTFGELEKLFPLNRVLRVHKSYMVAVKAIQSIRNDQIQLNDKVIPVSDSYKAQLNDVLFQ